MARADALALAPTGSRSNPATRFDPAPPVVFAHGTQLIDGFGRVHRDLRISSRTAATSVVQYCMPEEGMQWTPRSEILTFEEIERVARIMVERYGVDGIRLTGGDRWFVPVSRCSSRSSPTSGSTWR